MKIEVRKIGGGGFKGAADEEFISALRQGTNGGWPVGGDRFKREIAKALKCRVTPLPPGPKPKMAPDKRQPGFL